MWVIIVIAAIVIGSLKQINQYERGVKFMLGKYSGLMEPGWRIVLPVFQTYQKVDIRVRGVDVPDQDAITKDNVSTKINAVIYYKVKEANKTILEVRDYYFTILKLAQTTMRNVIGEVTLDELLSDRNTISKRISNIVDKTTEPWGIEVESVELKDILLPEEMKRIMGKQAEAEREKRATITKAEGEFIASDNLAKAAKMLSGTPGGLHLRTLSTIKDLSSDQSNTVVFAVPIEILEAIQGIIKK